MKLFSKRVEESAHRKFLPLFFLATAAVGYSTLKNETLPLLGDRQEKTAASLSKELTPIQGALERFSGPLLKGLSETPLNKPKERKAPNDPRTSGTAPSSDGEVEGSTQKWNLKDSGLSEQDLAPLLKKGDVSQITFFDDHITRVITPDEAPSKRPRPFSSIFISSEKRIDQIAQERLDEMNRLDEVNSAGEFAESELAKLNRLPLNAYFPLQFSPGLLDDRVTRIRTPSPREMINAIRAIDFPIDDQISPNDELGIKNIKSKVLTFGHGGELTLGINGNGFIANGPGADFALFENVIETLNSNGKAEYYQEFANVGVSEGDGKPIHWFPCDPKANVLSGCAGVVPTAKGGDLFDLSVVGLKKATRIYIRDVGYNYNKGGDQNEGFDFDGGHLFRAYQELN